MSLWTWVGLVAVILAAMALGLRRKLRRDAISQGGVRVGSAMLAHLVSPGTREARFVIVRGEPGFDETAVFEHQGQNFRIVSYSRKDESSTVLRRFLDVVCAVGPAPRP